MYIRAALLTGLFCALSVGSYYAAMVPLSSTSVDEDFYKDFSLLSRFDDKGAGYGGEIESDYMDIRNYLFNSSFNLVWTTSGTGINGDSITGNAFLLNLLIPDWMEDFHPDKKSYSPKSYVSGDEVVMLLGTSFSFASKIFDEVKDWKSEVNEKQKSQYDSEKVTLKNKSSKKSGNTLLFSHPWPTFSEHNPKFHQNHIYNLENTSYSTFDGDIQKPYYFSVNPENVEAIYAAVDLSLNKRLVDLNLSSKERLILDLYRVHTQNNSSVNWQSSLKDVYGNTYQMGVDFAVIKVKFHVANLRGRFLDYLVELYRKRTTLPKLDSYFEVENERTGSMFLGGWEAMTEREVDFHTMDNLFVGVKNGTGKRSGGRPELEIYESYLSRFSNNASPSQIYEIVNPVWYDNKEDGVSFLKYRIRNKNKGWISPKKRDFLFVNDSSESQTNDNREMLKTWEREKIASDRKLLSFLEAKPKVHARWKEYGVKYSYFPFQSIKSDLFLKTVTNSTLKSDSLNQNKAIATFSQNGKKYINVAHHLSIPNMNLYQGKGIAAIMQHSNKKEKIMVGMYDGVKNWLNPVSGKERYVGQVTMFISPWRYDLFNANNNLSKPSLGDVLKKKGLHNRLIHTNRFRINH